MLRRIVAVFCLMIAMMATVEAQNSFAYQAVIRNAKGELVSNQEISMQFSLIYNAKVVYCETHKTTTSQYGNVQVNVGEGKKVSGDFAAVPWSTMQVMMKIEADPNGGTNYIDLGTIQLQPAPYAMYAPAAGMVGTVQAGEPKSDSNALFEVKDKNGNVVFAVYPDGVRVFVEDSVDGKPMTTGFAVQGRRAAKEGEGVDLFSVTAEGTQVFVDDSVDGKPMTTGFAVQGRRAAGKDGNSDLFTVGPTGTQIYVDVTEDGKPMTTGFAVQGRRAAGKDSVGDKYFEINADGTRVFIENDTNNGKPMTTGFAVQGRRAAKDDSDNYRNNNKYMEITADGTQIYVDEDVDGKPMTTGFAVQGRRAAKDKAPKLFEVNSYGTKIYVDDSGDKPMTTGFAVQGRRAAGKSDVKYMVIDANGTNIYVDYEEAKAMSTGFAVAGRRAAKNGTASALLEVNNEDGTRVYIDDESGKPMTTGFAVQGRRAASKGISPLLKITNNTSLLTVEKNLSVQNKETNTNMLVMTQDFTKIVANIFAFIETNTNATMLVTEAEGLDVNTNVVLRGEVAQTVESEQIIEDEPIVMNAYGKIDTLNCFEKATALGDVDGYGLLKIYGEGLYALPQKPDANGNTFILFDAKGNITSISEDAVAAVVMTNAGTIDAKVLVWPLKQISNFYQISFGVMAADGTNQYVKVVAVVNSTSGIESEVGALAAVEGTGSVEIEGRTVYGNIITLTATPADGYHFNQWSDGDNSNPRTLKFAGETSFTAKFDINTYNISVDASDGGSVVGDGTYNHGDTVKLTAKADEHYHFVNWNGDSNLDKAELTFVAKNDTAFTATFAVNTNTVAYMVENDTVAVEIVAYGDTIKQSKVQPSKLGFTFRGWIIQPMIMPDEPVSVQADFEAIQYNIAFVNGTDTLYSNKFLYGEKPVYVGDEPAKTQTAQYKYTFIGWKPEINENTTVTDTATYTAQFKETLQEYKIIVNASPEQGGMVSGSSTYPYSEEANVTISASAYQGYKFAYWQDDETNKSETRTIAVTGTATYTAIFERSVATLTIGVTKGAGTVAAVYVINEGETSPISLEEGASSEETNYFTATCDLGKTIKLTATNSNGYQFKEWKSGGNRLSTDAEYTIDKFEGETSIDAVFEQVTFFVKSGNTGGDGLTADTGFGSIDEAISLMTNDKREYTINVCGDFSEGDDWMFSGTEAKSISIIGYGESDNKLPGVLVNTTAEVTFQSVQIGALAVTANGYGDSDKINVTLDNGAVITNSEKTTVGSYTLRGILDIADNSNITVTMKDGAEVSHNNVKDNLGGVYVGRSATFKMQGGSINSNKDGDVVVDEGAHILLSGKATAETIYLNNSFITIDGALSNATETVAWIGLEDDGYPTTDNPTVKVLETTNGIELTDAICKKFPVVPDLSQPDATYYVVNTDGNLEQVCLVMFYRTESEGDNVSSVLVGQQYVAVGKTITAPTLDGNEGFELGWNRMFNDGGTPYFKSFDITNYKVQTTDKYIWLVAAWTKVIHVGGEIADASAALGTEAHPYESIEAACAELTDATQNYKLKLKAGVTFTGQKIPQYVLAQSIIIDGEGDGGLDNAVIDGGNSSVGLTINTRAIIPIPITVQNLTIRNGNGSSGGGIYGYDGGENLTLGNGLTIANCSAYNGGAVSIGGIKDPTPNSAKLTILDGCEIYGNSATYGGAIYAYLTDICMEGGIIGSETNDEESKNSANRGGGIYLTEGSVLTMRGGSIMNNEGSGDDPYGGGMYVNDDCTFEMESGTISGNIAYGDYTYGGGIYSAGTIILKGGTISRNIAENGGAAYIQDGEIQMGGSIRIPSPGESGSNDIYLYNNDDVRIDIVEDFGEGTDTVAFITPNDYDRPVLATELEAVGGEHPEFQRFAVAPYYGDYYRIVSETDDDGKVLGKPEAFKAVEFGYYQYNSTTGWNEFKRVAFYEKNENDEDFEKYPAAPAENLPKELQGDSFVGWFTEGYSGLMPYNINEDGELVVDESTAWPFSESARVIAVRKKTKEVSGNMSLASACNALDYYCDYTFNLNGNYNTPQKIVADDKLYAITINGNNKTIDAGWKDDGSGNWTNTNGNAQGPALTINTSVPVTIKELTIKGGYNPDGYGGGIYIARSSAKVTLDGVNVEKNYAAYGGGVYAQGSLTMKDCNVSDNTAASEGGGVYVESDGVFNMENGAISGNTASSGGGVYINNAKMFMSGSAVVGKKDAVTVADVDNHSNMAGTGGGVYVANSSEVYLGYTDANKIDKNFTGGIYYNYARGDGGGVYHSGTFKMSGGTIEGNRTSWDGNGVYATGELQLSGSAKITSDNDVYLSGVIKIDDQLDGGNDIVATITPAIYVESNNNINKVVAGNYASESYNRFAITPEVGALWKINPDNGCLKHTSPYGAIYKEFSVSDTKKVYFSRGNLNYYGYTNKWRIATKQNAVVDASQNEQIESTNYPIDLFGWGTGDEARRCTETDADYTWNEWGDNEGANEYEIGSGCNKFLEGDWRTLTGAEWTHLLSRAGGKFGIATVDGVSGMILLPDDWTLPNGLPTFVSGYPEEGHPIENTYNHSQWILMENAGAVFLPMAGQRNGSGEGSVTGVGSEGNYWSSSQNNISGNAYSLNFGSNSVEIGNNERHLGYSVRLVQEVYDPNAFYVHPSDGGDGNDENSGHTSGKAFKTLRHALDVIKTAAQSAENKEFVIYINGVLIAEDFTISGCSENGISKLTIVGEGSASGISNSSVAVIVDDNIEVTLSNLKNLSGVEVRQGTVNIEGCVVKWCDWSGVEIMSGGTVNIENSQISGNDIGVWIKGGTLNLKSGAKILDHLDGGVDVDVDAGTVTVSGTAQAGDVQLAEGKKITIGKEGLSGSGIVATIKPANYDASVTVLTKEDGSLSAKEIARFAVASQMYGSDGGSLPAPISWKISKSGSLEKGIQGVLSGKFTVNAEGKQIRFSQGNLQYKRNDETVTWRFADNQYDYVGEANTNVTSRNYDGYIDMFGYGTSGWPGGATAYRPYDLGSSSDYLSESLTGHYANADWGVYNAITNGGGVAGLWRTLTRDEMRYLLQERSTPSGLQGFAAKVYGVDGYILLPDDWDAVAYPLSNVQSGIYNEITDTEWETYEAAGAVFMPAAGTLSATITGEGANVEWNNKSYSNSFGEYWVATWAEFNGVSGAWYWIVRNNRSGQANDVEGNVVGRSVRLVQDVNDLTFYVSPDGEDSDDRGTKEYPFKTLEYACMRMTEEKEYTIVLKGDLEEYQYIGGSNVKATKITIDGQNKQINTSSSSSLLTIATEIQVEIKNLTITGNSGVGVTGGGLYVGENSTVTLGEGTIITGNDVGSYGGGVYNEGQLFITSGAEISGNTAAYDGSGIYNNGGTITMTGGTISGNSAEQGGGGIYINGGTITMTGGTISGNSAAQGGAIYNEGVIIIEEDAEISNNTATKEDPDDEEAGKGGGIYNYENAKITMTGGTITGNSAAVDGGAVYLENYSDLYISGTAYIPAGVNSETGRGKNDVYLTAEDSYSTSLTIADDLSAETPVATITPQDYLLQVVTGPWIGSATNGHEDETPRINNYMKIGVTPDEDGNNYEVQENGRLQQK